MNTTINLELLEQMSNLQIALFAVLESQVGHTMRRPSRAVLGAKEGLRNSLQLLHFQYENHADESMQEDIDFLKKEFQCVIV